MSSLEAFESDGTSKNPISNKIPQLLVFLQKPEFSHLRVEFEQILDNYLDKSTRVCEEEIPELISNTAHDIAAMLKKAAVIARRDDGEKNTSH